MTRTFAIVMCIVVVGGCSKPAPPEKPIEITAAPPPPAAPAEPAQRAAPPAPPLEGVALPPQSSAPTVITPQPGQVSVVPPPPRVRVVSIDGAFAQKTAPVVRKATGPDALLDLLNNALKTYLAGGRPMPSGVEDLVRAGLVSSVPRAPEGMKFAVDAEQRAVVLVPAGTAAGR